MKRPGPMRVAPGRRPPSRPMGSAAHLVVGRVLRAAVARLRAAGIATARQDAELLLARVLATTRLALHLAPARPLDSGALVRFEAVLARRCAQEPVQYLLGVEDFADLRLLVGPGSFIPRPETELLVERAVARCPTRPATLIDLCTGSGAIACAVAVRHSAVTVWAVELDPGAAAWARTNVERLGLAERVHVREGDLFAPLAGLGLGGRADLILANPPYIAGPALPDLPEEVRAWEPALALDGGPDGLAVIARILDGAPAFARGGGAVLIEIGHDHADRLRARLADDRRYGPPTFHRDLLGYERVLELEVR
jgi:release factor glutamine methyltransferase